MTLTPFPKAITYVLAMMIALMLGIALAANASPLEDGADASNRGDYTTAIRLWRPLTDQGNAKAQTLIGLLYTGANGFKKDYAEAAKWLRLAADQGDAGAEYPLGLLYNEGKGVPQDYVEAAKWF